jgi:hypothetical protein
MSRRLLVLNGLIGLVGCLLAAALIREVVVPLSLPPPAVPRPAPPVAVPAAAPAAPVAAYGVIAAKNLFSPSRSEAPAGPVVTRGPTPLLHGVVMNGQKSRAFLEDPVAKRTFGYSIDDIIGSGRVQSITPDRVVIARPDGPVEVLLHDPAKPRAVPAASNGAPAPAPGAGAPPPRVQLRSAPETGTR